MSAVECSGRVQRYPGLFDESRSLIVAVPNCSTRYTDLRAARWRYDLATHTPSDPVLDGTGGSLWVSDVECTARVQRYPGLFDVSRSLSAAVLNCSTRYNDLRAARWRSDLATHTPSWTALAGACG